MSPEKKRRTFISYSSTNKEFALELALELRSSGFNIWLDQLDIPTGARWDDEVEKALDECAIFMVILTPASSASDNVKDEIGYAIDDGKRILPILLENAKVPLRLRRFQYVDFTNKSYAEGVESAKELLRKFVDEQTTPREQSSAADSAQKPERGSPKKKGQEIQHSDTPVVAETSKIKQEVESSSGFQTDEQVPFKAQPKPKEVAYQPAAESIVPSSGSVAPSKEKPKVPSLKLSRQTMIMGAGGGLIGLVLIIVILASVFSGGDDNERTVTPTQNQVAEVSFQEAAAIEPTKQPTATQVPASPTEPNTPTPKPDSSTSQTITLSREEGFVDLFIDNSHDWYTGSDEFGVKSISNGNYVWDVQMDRGYTDAWQLVGGDFLLSDFELSVDVKRNGGTPSNLCYGLVFRSTDPAITSTNSRAYYEFEVCDDHTYLITYFDGDEFIFMQDWTDYSGIHPNDWNTLEVKTTGDDFGYFINGNLVTELSDSTLGMGNVGISVYSYEETHGTILFDNFDLRFTGPVVYGSSEASQIYESEEVKGFYELATEQYSDDERKGFYESGEPIYLDLTTDKPLMLGYSYCAIDTSTLDNNNQSIEYNFNLNAAVIGEANKAYFESTTEDGWVCSIVYSIIDNWSSGEHFISQEMNVLAPINDGEYDYDPGVLEYQEYIVNVP